jgi:WNK lysine deficient protein kinase
VAWNEIPVAELAWTSDQAKDRTFEEIVVLKQLKHKNIMTLHDWWFDQKNSVICFITELFTDGTLRQ